MPQDDSANAWQSRSAASTAQRGRRPKHVSGLLANHAYVVRDVHKFSCNNERLIKLEGDLAVTSAGNPVKFCGDWATGNWTKPMKRELSQRPPKVPVASFGASSWGQSSSLRYATDKSTVNSNTVS